MLEKLKQDELIFHKAGLIIGAVVGVLLGLVVSDRADRYEIPVEEEAIVDGPEKD